MAVPASRSDFKDYCLRALGSPVLQINVDDTQVEDRIDEALYLYQEYHMDAVQKDYMKHQLTGSTMRFTGPSTGTFILNEIVKGNTSNAQGRIVSVPDANTLTFFTMMASNAFAFGETVTGQESGATGVIAPEDANTSLSGVVLGDYDNHYIDIPQSVIAVQRIFAPFESRIGGDILFDPLMQFNMSTMASFTSQGIVPYVMGRQYQSLLQETFRGRPMIRFQRHQNRLYIDVNFFANFLVNEWVIVECFRILDPSVYTDIWSDRWLQRYTIALIKRQWGTNLSKYNGIALPGGVTLDGHAMLTEAKEEVTALEEELKSTYQLPIDFFVG